MKKQIRKEKELRRKTLKKIREQGGPSCKLFWSDISRRKRKRKTIPRMKNKVGRVEEGQEDVLEELAKHWEELGRSSSQESEVTTEEDETGIEGVQSDICETVTFDEVVGILKQLKRGKAAGPDGILKEMLMYGGTKIVETLVQLFNTVICMLSKGLEKELCRTFIQGWGPRACQQLQGDCLGELFC